MSTSIILAACALVLMLILLLGMGLLIGITALIACLSGKQIKPEIQALIRDM